MLEQALTHRSAHANHNERLEFLGDAVLGMLVAAELFERRPDADEGTLTRLRAHLVCEHSLTKLARELDFSSELVLGPGELGSGAWRRASVLADALEAVVGAIYLDGGMAAAQRAVKALFRKSLKELPSDESLKDPKTRLQEWLQSRQRALPEYRVLDVSGPDHRKIFRVEACIGATATTEEYLATAQSGSRRGAEQAAARELLHQLRESEQ